MNILKLFSELIWETIYFPFWWYSKGLFEVVKSLFEFLKDKEKFLALSVWIKNIFRPMYGQNDFAGALISLVIRIFQIIFRSIVMVFWLVFVFVLLIIWLVLPILVFYEIYWQVV